MTKTPSKTGSNLLLRIAAAGVLVPVALAVAWLGGWVFVGFVVILGLIMASEWKMMVSSGAVQSGREKQKWYVVGAFYIILPLIALV